MPDPLPLTVAVPTYNRRVGTRALCEAILAQLRPGDELVVSDNASTDGTAAALADLSGVTVVAQPVSLGMVGNWNYCLTAGTHDWVCLIHSDDRLRPGGLAAVRRACAAAAGPALVTHAAWDVGHEPFRDDAFWLLTRDAGPSASLSAEHCASGTTIHRAVIDAVGRFDPGFAYSSDLEFFSRVCARFPSSIVRNPPVVEYVLHRDNAQLHTWRQPDFLDQLRAVRTASIAHAGLPPAEAARLLRQRLTRDVRFMLTTLGANGDRGEVRRLSRLFTGMDLIGRRLRAAVRLGARFGRVPGQLLR